MPAVAPPTSSSRWRLTVDELRTLLADNTDLVRGLFATLTQCVGTAGAAAVSSTGAAGDLRTLRIKA